MLLSFGVGPVLCRKGLLKMKQFRVVCLDDGSTCTMLAATPVEAIRLVVGRIYARDNATVWGRNSVMIGSYEVEL